MSPLPINSTESTTYSFNARELARLAIYRAAVAASFYTDQCDYEQPPLRGDMETPRLVELFRDEARAA